VQGNQSYLRLQFSAPQRVVGFFYRDPLSTSVTLTASSAGWTPVEMHKFPGKEGYAGFIRPSADISFLEVQAPHRTEQEAQQSRLSIDDVSFGRIQIPALPRPAVERGSVVIVLGGVRADGGGILIGPHGVTPVPPSNPAFREVAAAATVLAEAE